MIALVKEHKLTDGTSVYDVEIQEAGVTMVSIPCPSHLNALQVLYALDAHSNLQVKWKDAR